MKKSLLFSILIISIFHSFAQTIIDRDPAIQKMVSEVSKDSLESYVRKLVSFGTRNTLSTQTDPKRGYWRCTQLGIESVQRVCKTIQWPVDPHLLIPSRFSLTDAGWMLLFCLVML